jgi:ribokinase
LKNSRVVKKSRILVVGSSNTDMIVRLNRLPGPGETVIGGKFSTAPGGKGANQAVGAARAGAEVTFIGRVGRDAFGASALENLKGDGINVSHVARDRAAPSGVAFICVADGGENSIAVASGSNDCLSVADVRRASAAFRGADIVLVQLETPLATVAAAIDLAAKAGATVILNPAPARPLPDRLLRKVSILTPNEHEAELLTGVKVVGRPSAARAADILLRRGVGTVIVTLGRRGAFVARGSIREWMAAFKVQAVDTTAAGDIFNGALAVGLGEGLELSDAVRFAQAAAAISVTRAGAQPSAPRRSEIERLLHRRPRAGSRS